MRYRPSAEANRTLRSASLHEAEIDESVSWLSGSLASANTAATFQPQTHLLQQSIEVRGQTNRGSLVDVRFLQQETQTQGIPLRSGHQSVGVEVGTPLRQRANVSVVQGTQCQDLVGNGQG